MNSRSEIVPILYLALLVFLQLRSPYTPSLMFLVPRGDTGTAGFASPAFFPGFVGGGVGVEESVVRLWVSPLECGCWKVDAMDEGACYGRPKKGKEKKKKKLGLDVLHLITEQIGTSHSNVDRECNDSMR